MHKYQLTILLLVVVTSFAPAVLADEFANTAPQQNSIQWERYLSPADWEDIALKLITQEMDRRKREGLPLYGNEGPTKFSVRMQQQEGGQERSAVPPGAGNLNCNINVQNPHKGDISGQQLPKAKASGTCDYEHLSGTPPVSFGFNLFQILNRAPAAEGLWSNPNWEYGLSVSWSPPEAQTVYAPTCANDSYLHTVLVYFVPPPGWTINTQNPRFIEIKLGVIDNC